MMLPLHFDDYVLSVELAVLLATILVAVVAYLLLRAHRQP